MGEQIRFGRAKNIEVQLTNLNEVRTGDINNDGRPDVVIRGDDQGQDQVAVWLNQGQQTFTRAGALDFQDSPTDFDLADLDGDGALDLAVALGSGNAVRLFTGQGDGSFTAATRIDTAGAAAAVRLSDMTGDGHPDVVLGKSGPTEVAIHANDGQGGFPAQADRSVGAREIHALTTGDLDNDGRKDVITVDGGFFGGHQVILNPSDGLNVRDSLFPDGSAIDPFWVETADFNEDGNLDWIAAEIVSGAQIYLGDGQGGTTGEVVLDTGGDTLSALTGDVNNDGHTDVVLVHAGGTAGRFVSVHEGRGDGSFADPVRVEVNGDMETLRQADLADVDRDGYADLVVPNLNPNGALSIVENLGGESLPATDPRIGWVRTLGTAQDDKALAVETGPNGYVYTAVSTGVGPQVFKIDPTDGGTVWSTAFSADNIADIAVSSTGDIYAVGSTTGNVADLDEHVSARTGGPADPGIADIVVGRIGEDGEEAWTKQVGSRDLDSAPRVAVDADGRAHVLATVGGSTDAGQQAQINEPDVGLFRFSDDGVLELTRTYGTANNPDLPGFSNQDGVSAVTYDAVTDSLVFAGTTTGTLSQFFIDGQTGTSAPDHAGSGSGYWMRVDPESGMPQQTRQFEMDSAVSDIESVLARGGEVVLAGSSTDPLNGDDSAVVQRTGTPYVIRWDSTGSRDWIEQRPGGNQGTDITDIAYGPGGIWAAGQAAPFIQAYDGQGRMFEEAYEIFPEAGPGGTSFRDGAQSIAVQSNAAYVVGEVSNAWAGPVEGAGDGWIARIDLGLSDGETESESAGTLEFLSLSPAKMISALYVGWFGRAPEVEGLDFWTGEIAKALDDGKSLGQAVKDIAETFRAGGEAAQRYPFLDTSAEAPTRDQVEGLVADMYDNFFDRAPESGGLKFWADTIETRLQDDDPLGDIIFNIVSGATDDGEADIDGDGKTEGPFNDRATVLNRIDVAERHGESVAQADFNGQDAAALIDSVGTGGATAERALDMAERLGAGLDVDFAAASQAADPMVG